MKSTFKDSYTNNKVGIWDKAKFFWDNGMLSLRVGANRKDSLFIAGGMCYTNLLIGIFYEPIYIPTIILGIFCLALDNHNLEKKRK